MTLKEVICWLSEKSIEDKLVFIEILLQETTVVNRLLWSDFNISDKDKLESLKWSNELAHRVWSILFDLKTGLNKDYEGNLLENIRFYSKQSEVLKSYLPSMIIATVSRFNDIKKKRENSERR